MAYARISDVCLSAKRETTEAGTAHATVLTTISQAEYDVDLHRLTWKSRRIASAKMTSSLLVRWMQTQDDQHVGTVARSVSASLGGRLLICFNLCYIVCLLIRRRQVRSATWLPLLSHDSNPHSAACFAMSGTSHPRMALSRTANAELARASCWNH